MARVSTKKTTAKKPTKAAAAAAAAAAESPAVETPVAEAPWVERPKVENQKPAPAPVEPDLPAERTVDSIKAAAQADAQKDADSFSAPTTSAESRPPSAPMEPTGEDTRFAAERRGGYQRDKVATSLNIAKLQAMSMTELNAMAKEYAVENYGTMRKHEVI